MLNNFSVTMPAVEKARRNRLPAPRDLCDKRVMSGEHASLHRPSGTEANRWPLLRLHRVGRATDCHLSLDDARVSITHASLRHVGDGNWVLRDLGSKNGTFLNGQRIQSGLDCKLTGDDVICFGHALSRWSFAPGLPCDVVVTELGGTTSIVVAAGSDVLAVPGAENVHGTLLRRRAEWVLEGPEAELSPLLDGQIFSLSGKPYRVWISSETTATEEITAAQKRLGGAILKLFVSRDEEQVKCEFAVGQESVSMPTRVYLYLLVLLGRYREQDSAAGVPVAEAGWRYADDICRALAVDPQVLNVQVYRARKDIARLGFSDPGALVERRAMTRQLRLGIPPERLLIRPL